MKKDGNSHRKSPERETSKREYPGETLNSSFSLM